MKALVCPTIPCEPRAPHHPEEYFESGEVVWSDSDGSYTYHTIQELLDIARAYDPKVEPKDITISIESEVEKAMYYDDYFTKTCIDLSINKKKPNPKYQEELAAYERAVKRYMTKHKKYLEDLAAYEIVLDKYNLAKAKTTAKKLQKKLAKKNE